MRLLLFIIIGLIALPFAGIAIVLVIALIAGAIVWYACKLLYALYTIGDIDDPH